MDSHIKRNILVAFLGLMLVCLALAALYFYEFYRIDYSAIDYIESLQKGPGNFLDLAGDIGVTSADDLGYEIKGRYNIVIHYGKQIIKMNTRCFKSDEYKDRIKRIGLEVKTHDTKDENGTILYRITYWGEEIELWSRVD